MPSPPIALCRPHPQPHRPTMVLGPSLGTSADSLWGQLLPTLATEFDVLAWDLPGHGRSAPAGVAYDVAELAAAVVSAVDSVRPGAFHYAGDSLGGAVGLQLLLDHPDRVSAATLLCTGAKIGESAAWQQRATLVETEGTDAVVDGSKQRWFGPGFLEREPAVAEILLDALRATHPPDYANACRALAAFDVRDRLGEITAPVLAVAGAADEPTPVSALRAIADGVVHGRLVVLDGVAHLAPAEDPVTVADLLIEHHTDTSRTRTVHIGDTT